MNEWKKKRGDEKKWCNEQRCNEEMEEVLVVWGARPSAGVMKKWHFKGMPASHGVSLSHRHGGAIGGRTDPGKVWKGKKMPGNMGDDRRTVHDCLVYKVGCVWVVCCVRQGV